MSSTSMNSARVLYADPPWAFDDHLPGAGRGAGKHYACLPFHEIARFPLPPIQRDAWCFLWRVRTHDEEAHAVMRAWGFTFCGEIVWVKRTRSGKDHFGMGRVVRNGHEVCLIGKRGKVEPASHSVRSVLYAPVGVHSAKPIEMYALIEQLTGYGPFLEVFARARRAGWDSIGNELGAGS